MKASDLLDIGEGEELSNLLVFNSPSVRYTISAKAMVLSIAL